MEYKELKEKMQELFESVSTFAYHELGEIQIPEDFKFSSEVEKLAKEKEEAYKKYKNHPQYKVWNSNDKEFLTLREAYFNIPSQELNKTNEYLEFLGIGKIEEVEQHGGEGMGDSWYSVKYFPKHNVYMRVDGWYQSHHGTDFNGWEDVTQVKPITKSVVFYE